MILLIQQLVNWQGDRRIGVFQEYDTYGNNIEIEEFAKNNPTHLIIMEIQE